MKKPNLAEKPTSFAIVIEPTSGPSEGPADDDQSYYKVSAPTAKVGVAFSVPKGTAEEDVTTSAKRRIAAELALTEMQGLVLGTERAAAEALPIGCLRVSLQLPVREAIEQIVQQSAKTAK